MADRSIVITGGGGRLAKALKACLPTAVLFNRRALDVTNRKDCESLRTIRDSYGRAVDRVGIPVVIHCAAVLSVEAEKDKLKAWAVNVEGTRNVARVCAAAAVRLVYISSDYVFGQEHLGERKMMRREDDKEGPVNFYGLTKCEGEQIALDSPNNLVLRAPFRYGPPWAYGNAFADQWTSARWLHEVAPDVAEAALSDLTGVLHIGGPRRSLLQMARTVSPDVTPSMREDWPGLAIPQDTSLDSSRWNSWKANKQGSLLAGVSK